MAGVDTGGVDARGDPARPEEALELEIDAVLSVVPCGGGTVVATESGCWSGPNHRAAPAPAPIATARTSRDSAASLRRRGVKSEDSCRLMRGQQLAVESESHVWVFASERSSRFDVRLDVGVGQIRRDRHLDVVGQGVAALDRPVGRNQDGE